MCLIIASPTGKRIPQDILEDAEKSNSHGGGVAWLDRDKGKICFQKGLDLDGVTAVLDGPALGKPHVVHFRIASVGGVCDELTHPFVISEKTPVDLEGEVDAVLFQNGSWMSWKDTLVTAIARGGIKTPKAPWSDARAMALVCHVYGYEILSLLEESKSSRWLVFDATAGDAPIAVWGSWHDWGGFKFSHQGPKCFNHGYGQHNDRRPFVPAPAVSTVGAPNTPNSGTADRSETSNKVRRYKPKKGEKGVWSVFSNRGLPHAEIES